MKKPVVEQLAHSLGRNDEQPNVALAIRIAGSGDATAVAALVQLLTGANTALAHDAIKVLYETGERHPGLIVPYTATFIQLLHHPNNRMKWGAMSALAAISHLEPGPLGKHIVLIVEAMDSGTVITRDHGMRILANLARVKKYHTDCMDLLLEQLERAPVNQFPMYAELTLPVISQPFKDRFAKIIRSRKDVAGIPSKKKRIDKVLKQLNPAK